jgi:hypothetical protein
MPVGPVWQNLSFADTNSRLALKSAEIWREPCRRFEAKWDDPKSGTLEASALAYLRVNCGHCHKPTGSASNSGLFYDDH